MPTRTVFSDTDNNEMDCVINDKGKLYISIGQIGDEGMYNGYIALDKEDAQKLIKLLTELESEMTE
jgi:hypothetical protein